MIVCYSINCLQCQNHLLVIFDGLSPCNFFLIFILCKEVFLKIIKFSGYTSRISGCFKTGYVNIKFHRQKQIGGGEEEEKVKEK